MMNRRFLLALFLASAAVAQNTSLKIVIVEGQGAINNIRLPRSKEPVIEVVDPDGAPIPGVAVNFTLPPTGPGGDFLDGKTLSTVTDEHGRAVGRGLHANKVTGQYTIEISASYHGETAHAAVTQTNAEPAALEKKGSSKKFLWIALIGAAAAGGA